MEWSYPVFKKLDSLIHNKLRMWVRKKRVQDISDDTEVMVNKMEEKASIKTSAINACLLRHLPCICFLLLFLGERE